MNIPEIVITCCNTNCGISFAVPKWWETGKRENHSWFYCPNGHHQHFAEESDLEIAQRERDIAKQQVARAEQERDAAIKAEDKAHADKRLALLKVKKLEKRAAAGTCPCCQRSFANMTTHMRKQHPAFVAEQTNVVPMKKAK